MNHKILPVLMMALLAAPLLSQQWFASNSSAMKISRVTGLQAEGWFLKVDGQTETLYHDSQEQERWVETSSGNIRRVDYLSLGALRKRNIYQADGSLAKIEYYQDKQLMGAESFYYQQRQLVRVERTDAAKRIVWQRDYQRRLDGSLAASYQQNFDQDGKLVSIPYALINSAGARLLQRRGNRQLEFFDQRGFLKEKLEYRGDALFRRISFLRQNDRLVEQRISLPLKGLLRIERYNVSGQLSSDHTFENEVLKQENSYRYNADNLLIEEERIGKEVLTLRYSYRENSREVEKIDYYRWNELLRTRFDIKPEPASYSERFYVDGRPVVLRIYRSNALVEERVLQENVEEFKPTLPPLSGL